MMLSPPRNQRASPSPCWWAIGFALAFTDIALPSSFRETSCISMSPTLQPLAIEVKFHGTTCIVAAMTRRYELKRRAERQDETRQRIVDATIELHQTIGAAQTTVSEIAKRAGVGRVTVYRHFPDEETLFNACSGQ